MDLSVLICSTHTRWRTFGAAIQEQIWQQYNGLAPGFQAAVEILMLTDNKAMMLGAKRNAMVDIAQGRYIAFVDDDDRISDDYIVSLLDAIRSGADVITFLASVSINGADPRICRYSKNFAADRNLPDSYERLPNHLMCVKRDLASKVAFPHVAHGEDSGYSKQLAPLLTSEHAIDRVLYHYDYNDATTETQQFKRNKMRPRRNQEPLVDVIILSKADTKELRRMTQATVSGVAHTSGGLPLNIIVMEQVHHVAYRDAITITAPAEFNYNRFANQAAAMGRAPWILVCNNDLLFHPGWLEELLAANYPFVSPKCPRDQRQDQFTENTVGDLTGRHMSGWCFMVARTLWERIGGFDDCVTFWCSDDAVLEQARAVGVQPMIVPNALVEHIQSVTLRQQDNRDDLMWRQVEVFSAKYGPHRLARDPRYRNWRRRHGAQKS